MWGINLVCGYGIFDILIVVLYLCVNGCWYSVGDDYRFCMVVVWCVVCFFWGGVC